jgi:hypothetical protein
MSHRKLRILFPLRTTSEHFVPPTFFATGLVRHPDVRSVRARVRVNPDDEWQNGHPIHFLPVTLRGRAVGDRRRNHAPLLRWVVRFEGVTGSEVQKFQLRVEGLNRVGGDDSNVIANVDDEIEVYIDTQMEVGAPKRVPHYDFPPDDYVISGPEQDYFVAFGTVDTGKPVTNAAIDEVAAAFFSTEEQTWWAEFTGLGNDPGPTPEGETLSLVVTNTDGAALRNVTIETDDGTEAPEEVIFP